MADIRPFRAFRYDPARVSLADVVTQPYDKITPQMQERYQQASPYNLVRIILGRKETSDNQRSNVYCRAAACLADWRRSGVLKQDSASAIYGYSQSFPDSDQLLERRGFIALGRLEDYSSGVVFPHEQTLAKPKADRLSLLRATRAHFGQIFMLYEDSGHIQRLLANNTDRESAITDEFGVLHRMWSVDDQAVVQSVKAEMTDKKLIIADGHHRYETALAYRDECRTAGSATVSGKEAPAEYVMMTFVNIHDPALCILPTHRVVHSLSAFSPEQFRKSARAFFDVDEVDPAIDSLRGRAMLREAGRSGTAMLAVSANRAFFLHHPNPAMPELAGVSIHQQSLDVVQLHKCLLEKVLNLTEESIRNQQNISYVRDPAQALSEVREGRANLAFLINPCRVAQVRDIAFAGEVMPQKSTDFYPKLLSGLTIYALD